MTVKNTIHNLKYLREITTSHTVKQVQYKWYWCYYSNWVVKSDSVNLIECDSIYYVITSVALYTTYWPLNVKLTVQYH